ncbi:MAG: hypothetical protein AAFV72_16375 [Cyanobacteria bacterium J06635_1]
MASEYLEAERQRIADAISIIAVGGSVAPSNVWISPYEKKGHLYHKLTSNNPKVKNQHLNALALQDWRLRIQRRDLIAELEMQLKMLDALIERQNRAAPELSLPADRPEP